MDPGRRRGRGGWRLDGHRSHGLWARGDVARLVPRLARHGRLPRDRPHPAHPAAEFLGLLGVRRPRLDPVGRGEPTRCPILQVVVLVVLVVEQAEIHHGLLHERGCHTFSCPPQRSACSRTQAGLCDPFLAPARRIGRQVRPLQRAGPAALPGPGHARPFAEERPTDPHHRRPGRHGHFQIVTHTHGTLRQPECRPPAVPPSREGLRRRIGTRRGHGHEPGDVEPETAQPCHQVGHLRRRAAVAPRQTRRLDLDHDRRLGREPCDASSLRLRGPRSARPGRTGPARAPCCAGSRRGSASSVPARPPRPDTRRPWPRARRRSSRPRRPSPASSAACTASRPKPFVTATTRTTGGVAARAGDPLPDDGEVAGDLVASARRRGRRNRRHPGRAGFPPRRRRRRRCPRARECRRCAETRSDSAACGSVVPALEAGGDHGHPHLVAHVVVDHGAEDDVGVRVGDGMDDLGRLVHLEQPQVGSRRRCSSGSLGRPRWTPRAAGT